VNEANRPIGKGAASAHRPRVSVVIPALNEARNLPHVAARLPAGVDEIVFVDGDSVDGTAEVARSLWPDAIHLRQTRKGKGNALSCGFAAATGDIIVMIDADGSTDPAEIPAFVGLLQAGADYAKGSRFVQGGGSDDITRLRRVGNRLLNLAVNAVFRTRYTDLCYGYNAFWRRHLAAFSLPDPYAGGPRWGDGFEVETLITVRSAVAGLAVAEVPSHERARISGESNLRVVRDGLRVLGTIGREYLRRHRMRRSQRGRPPVAVLAIRPAGAAALIPADGTWAS
jgi:glycosyltransferase involved in cell wall biosynthesis